MNRIPAQSRQAGEALQLVEALQERLVSALEMRCRQPFDQVEWLRDEGLHGGGQRFGISDATLLGRASVNVSQIHYDNEPTRKLGSASALSTIVHPSHPLAPSVHIHISWTEQKSGAGYWRMMADLNPAIPNDGDRQRFAGALKKAAPERFKDAADQGDRYFYIPALQRHRGVIHFYLENYNSGDFGADLGLARKVGESAIDTYIDILDEAVNDAPGPSEDQQAAQLAYHTLYFFQVLTLDRGTTTGLLVHDQNDIGILGSLPPRIDKNLLASWRSRMCAPQDMLLDGLLGALPDQGVCAIGDAIKHRLARAVRAHYKAHPDSLDLQASGNARPPTIENHQ